MWQGGAQLPTDVKLLQNHIHVVSGFSLYPLTIPLVFYRSNSDAMVELWSPKHRCLVNLCVVSFVTSADLPRR